VRLFGTVAFAATIAAPVMAADLPVDVPYRPLPPVLVYNWTGCYVGVSVGYAWQRDKDDETITATHVPSNFSPTSTPQPSGVKAGGYAGCNWQASRSFVAGLEVDAEYANLKASAIYPNTVNHYYESDTTLQGSVRGRLGVAFDRLLVYATGGVAFATIKNTYYGGNVETFDHVRVGGTVGAGVEYAFNYNWLARIEYRYTDFGQVTNDSVIAFPGFTEKHRTTENAVRAGITYRFGNPIVPGY
jgi:outer membrane immunogenic protein